ncbi:hypothetical protein [Sorangium sp. So ce381]
MARSPAAPLDGAAISVRFARAVHHAVLEQEVVVHRRDVDPR